MDRLFSVLCNLLFQLRSGVPSTVWGVIGTANEQGRKRQHFASTIWIPELYESSSVLVGAVFMADLVHGKAEKMRRNQSGFYQHYKY